MGKKKRSKIKSECCKAEVRYSDPAPDFIGDDPKTMRIGTVYAICTKCNQPCNIYIPIRKVWTRNPKTQVQGDKRGKIKKKEIKKEIQEIGNA
jgi:L-lactate utilization protein LutB